MSYYNFFLYLFISCVNFFYFEVGGDDIQCLLMVATKPRIIIKNFDTISANTPVNFHIVNVVCAKVVTNGEIELNLIYLQNRIYNTLNAFKFIYNIVAAAPVGISKNKYYKKLYPKLQLPPKPLFILPVRFILTST
jgi:hypothetical protein